MNEGIVLENSFVGRIANPSYGLCNYGIDLAEYAVQEPFIVQHILPRHRGAC